MILDMLGCYLAHAMAAFGAADCDTPSVATRGPGDEPLSFQLVQDWGQG